MDYNLNIAKFGPKRDELPEESGKFGLARHYKGLPTKSVSFQDNLQSAVSHHIREGKSRNPSSTLKRGDTLSHIAVHVLKKNKEKITPEAINVMVNNIALKNKIKIPILSFRGKK